MLTNEKNYFGKYSKEWFQGQPTKPKKYNGRNLRFQGLINKENRADRGLLSFFFPLEFLTYIALSLTNTQWQGLRMDESGDSTDVKVEVKVLSRIIQV